jgi:hypothetical protein
VKDPLSYQLSVTDYYRMAQAGILGEGDRCELIDGEIIDMAPIGSEHASTVKHLLRQFQQAVGNSAIVSIQDPVRLDTHNEPQPDIALLILGRVQVETNYPRPCG